LSIQETVKSQTTYLIIPFGFKHELSRTLDLINLNRDIFEPAENEVRDHFFDHIECLVKSNADLQMSIGQKYTLKHAKRKEMGLPPNTNSRLELIVKDNKLAIISIEEIHLYLFESQVGFLTIKICFTPDTSLDHIIEANYYLKKFIQRDIQLKFKTGPNIEDTKGVILGDLISELTSTLDVATFFEADKQKPTKALIFSSSLLNYSFQDREQLNASLFRISRGFKSSYLPNKMALQTNTSQGLLSLFQNSHWGVAFEGLANIVEHADEKTNRFFDSNYSSNLEKTYFYMYILTLHQRYGLLNFSIQVSELSRRYEELTKNPIEQLDYVTKVYQKLVAFKLRSTFSQVSNVTHQDELYAEMRSVLKIDILLKELHFEMDTLNSLMEIAAKREQLKREEITKHENERFHQVVGLLSFLFVPMGLLTGFWGMNFDFLQSYSGRYFLITAILLYVVCFMMYHVLRYMYRVKK
jgi:hypothetical protein